jgi:hypothetical protein
LQLDQKKKCVQDDAGTIKKKTDTLQWDSGDDAMMVYEELAGHHPAHCKLKDIKV